jgi:hypothetical protein
MALIRPLGGLLQMLLRVVGARPAGEFDTVGMHDYVSVGLVSYDLETDTIPGTLDLAPHAVPIRDLTRILFQQQ